MNITGLVRRLIASRRRPMNIAEVRKALALIPLPSFVREVHARVNSFNTFPAVQRDYTLFVRLTNRELDPYTAAGDRLALSNHPFSFPGSEDELRGQVAAAIVMAVTHETIEQISAGGVHFCSPHAFKGGSDPDTHQWLMLLDGLHGVVREYATAMPAHR